MHGCAGRYQNKQLLRRQDETFVFHTFVAYCEPHYTHELSVSAYVLFRCSRKSLRCSALRAVDVMPLFWAAMFSSWFVWTLCASAVCGVCVCVLVRILWTVPAPDCAL